MSETIDATRADGGVMFPCCRGVGEHADGCKQRAHYDYSDNARAIAEAQERIEEGERADVADRMLAREMERRDEECEPEIADPERGVWAGPDGARALLASLEHADHVDPDSVTMLQTSLGFACDEVDALRARVEDLEQDARAIETARLRAEVEQRRLTVEMLNLAAAGHVADLEAERAEVARMRPIVDAAIALRDEDYIAAGMSGGLVCNDPFVYASLARLYDATDKAYPEHAPDRESLPPHPLEALLDGLRDRLYEIAESLGAKLPRVAERYADDARLRIELGVADLQRRATYLLNSRDYWQAKAKRLERRVAVLTEERDGLTLRLGEKVARGIKQPRKRGGKAER